MHEFFFENVRNPARSRRAGLIRQFCPGQVYSSDFLTWLVEGPMGAKQFCTVTLNNTCFCIFFYVNTIDDKLKCSQRLLLCQNSMQRRDLTPFLLQFFISLEKTLHKSTVIRPQTARVRSRGGLTGLEITDLLAR